MINNNNKNISLNKNSKKKNYILNTIITTKINLKKQNKIKKAYINNYKNFIGKNIFLILLRIKLRTNKDIIYPY
jgi:hypothetical protein